MKEIELLVRSQQLVHLQNPVRTRCLSNVAVSMDPADNIKPNKERSEEKIDGVVAMAMAIGWILARQSRRREGHHVRARGSVVAAVSEVEVI